MHNVYFRMMFVPQSYDILHCQRMKFVTNENWRNVYEELAAVNKEYAEKIDIFMAV